MYLDDAGYHTRHRTPGYLLLEKPIVLTFDDGYRDAYEAVFLLLLEHGFTGTFRARLVGPLRAARVSHLGADSGSGEFSYWI